MRFPVCPALLLRPTRRARKPAGLPLAGDPTNGLKALDLKHRRHNLRSIVQECHARRPSFRSLRRIRLRTDARVFLQGSSPATWKGSLDAPAFGALLTPQGKILFDFFVVQTGEDFLLDAPRERAADLVKRLGFCRLRSKVQIEDLSTMRVATTPWSSPCSRRCVGPRMRSPMPIRARRRSAVIILPRPAAEALATDAPALYEAHRIACGVPKGGLDFALTATPFRMRPTWTCCTASPSTELLRRTGSRVAHAASRAGAKRVLKVEVEDAARRRHSRRRDLGRRARRRPRRQGASPRCGRTGWTGEGRAADGGRRAPSRPA